MGCENSTNAAAASGSRREEANPLAINIQKDAGCRTEAEPTVAPRSDNDCEGNADREDLESVSFDDSSLVDLTDDIGDIDDIDRDDLPEMETLVSPSHGSNPKVWKDKVYTAFGVDKSKALATYGIGDPLTINASHLIKVMPNADDSFQVGTVSTQEARKLQRRAEARRKMQDALGVDPLFIRTHSSTPSTFSETPSGSFVNSTPSSLSATTPEAPLMPVHYRPSITGQVKKPRIANLEPYLRLVDVAVVGPDVISSSGNRIKVLCLTPDEKELAWCSNVDTALFMANLPETLCRRSNAPTHCNKLGGNGAGGMSTPRADRPATSRAAQSVASFGWGPAHPLGGHKDRIVSAALAPNGLGYNVATCSIDRWCVIWDRSKGQIQDAKVMLSHSRAVACVNFSHNYQFLVTACQDQVARVYVARSGKPVAVYNKHTDCIFHCCFSPDDSIVASCSFDLTIHLWSPRESNRTHAVLRGHEKIPYTSSFTPDGRRLVSNDEAEVRVWELATQSCCRIFRVEDCVPLPPLVTPKGSKRPRKSAWTFSSVAPGQRLGNTHFVAVTTSGTVHIFDIDHGTRPTTTTPSGTFERNESTNTFFDRARSNSTSLRQTSILEDRPRKSPSMQIDNQGRQGTEDSTAFLLTTLDSSNTRSSSNMLGDQAFTSTSSTKSLHGDKRAEVWSYKCRAGVYALHCGPSATIAVGDIAGNVYIIKVIAG